MEAKIIYRGWPGHFCCGHRCIFHLNTLIEYGKKKIVVSTVGLMLDPMNEDKNKIKYGEIGYNRYFETMAFEAEKKGEFWDANVQTQINFDSPCNYKSVNDELKANDGHIKVVQEIVEKLKKGTI
jgi:hypothetical protein